MSRVNGSESSGAVRHVFIYVVAGYLLLWVALLNGYPIFYPDSAGYVMNSFDLKQPIYRTVGYSIFIRLVNLGSSPWLIVIAQCLIAVFVLYSVYQFIVRGLDRAMREDLVFLGLIAFIALGTTFPWFVGEIMPDVFTGLTFLSLFLLLYDADMNLRRSLLMCLVFCISIGSHITHLLVAGALLPVVFVLGSLRAFHWLRPVRATKDIVAFVLMPILAIALLTAFSNWRVGYGFALSPAKNVFLFARLMESGLAPAYLQERCKTEELTPCQYVQSLPATSDQLLWKSSLIEDMGGWYGARAEAGRIVAGTIQHNPVGFVEECAKQMVRQFVEFTPGDENYPYLSGPNIDVFLHLYPGEAPRYFVSRQSMGKLRSDGKRVAAIDAAVFWCSFGICFAALFSKRLQRMEANQLFALTVIFLLGNALTTGALSSVQPRYQARASWLMAICCAAYVLPWIIKWGNRKTAPALRFEKVDAVDV